MIRKTDPAIFTVFIILVFFPVASVWAQNKVVVIPLMETAAGPAAPVPKTGQTSCYKSAAPWGTCTCGTADCLPGQDGDLEKGVAWPNPRFADHGNGTVTDKLTGLIWLKDGDCSFHPTNPAFPNERDWTGALAACIQLASGTGRCDLTDGSSAGDWRLPNREELASLIDLGQNSPTLQIGCPLASSTANAYYWSATTSVGGSANAWIVNFNSGVVYTNSKSYSYHLRCVR